MKRTKKILFALLLISLLIFSLSIPASAEESAENATDGEAAVGGENITEGTDEAGATANAFELLYIFFEENSAEIFSILAFIGSLFVAFAYKKGMLPALSSAIGSVGRAVGGLRDESEGAIASLKEQGADILAKMGITEESLSDAAESLKKLSEKLETAERTERELSNIRTALAVEIDVLYDIFMASSLPQYRKDIIGERVSEMKKSLEAPDYEEAAS